MPIVLGRKGGASGGGAPSGPAGGDLSGTYPNPTVTNLIPKTLLDAKGDLIGATAADTAARLAVGTNGKVLEAASGETTGLKWDYPPGYELSYVEATANVTITATVEGTPTEVLSAGAVTFDGATRVCIEYFTPQLAVSGTAGAFTILNLWDADASDLGRCALASGVITASISGPCHVRRFLTPAAATKTYKIKGWRVNGDGTAAAGAGGAGVAMPMFIRITVA